MVVKFRQNKWFFFVHVLTEVRVTQKLLSVLNL